MNDGYALGMLALLLLFACSGSDPDPSGPGAAAALTCADLMDGGPAATSEAELQELLDAVQRELFPELAGVAVRLEPNESVVSYFSAQPDLSTLDAAPLERTYIIQYSTVQFADPPPADAVVAILVHELKHVVDYTEMTAEEVVAFGIWYVTNDISDYERQTDEHSLQLGCADGLIAFREWLYDHVTPEVEAEKRVNYYTPEEIEAWVEANG